MMKLKTNKTSTKELRKKLKIKEIGTGVEISRTKRIKL